MRHTFVLLALFVSLFCSNTAARAGGDTPQPLGSDVVWYQDTTGNSPFKNAFIGMWYAPDGKIVVPQGKQLFLVDPETGKVVDKKEVGFDIKFYCVANDRFLLATDTVIYVYNKSTYELVKKLDLPESITNRPLSDFYLGRIHSYIDQLSPDGKTIIVGYTLKNGKTEMGKFDVETGKYEMIKISTLFICTYSPDGKYFIADEKFANESARPIIYKADDLVNMVYNTGKNIKGSAGNFNFSANSQIFYFQYESGGNHFYSIDLSNGFKLDSFSISGNEIAQMVGINDSLSYVFYGNHTDPYPSRGIMNTKSKSVIYKYSLYLPGAYCYVEPQKNSFILMNYTEIYKVKIPYDKITKTEEEIQQINTGFTLSPNPAYEIVNYSIYITKDQNIKYSISQIDGKEIKTGEIGACSAGYATGSLYLQDIPVGDYIVVFYGEEGRVAQGKVCLVR